MPRDSDWPEAVVVPVVSVVPASREAGLEVVDSKQVVAAEAEL